MSLKVILFAIGAIVLGATLFLDSRITPIIGASLLLAAIVYGWVQNKRAGEENYRKAERAAARQRDRRAQESR